MPQFDFFTWTSSCFWTVFSFHAFYFLFLREVIVPVAEYQKTIQKLAATFCVPRKAAYVKDTFFLLYFKK